MKLCNFLISIFLLCTLFSCTKELPFHAVSVKSTLDNSANYFSSITTNLELQDMVLDQYQKAGVEEFPIYDVFNNINVDTRTIPGYIINDPMQVVAYPSLAFFSESLQEHISQIDFTVIIDEDFNSLDSLDAYDSNGNQTKILNYFDESKRYQVVKYNESEIAIELGTMKDYFGQDAPISIIDFTAKRQIGNYSIFSSSDYGNAVHKDNGNYLFGPTGPGIPLGPATPPTNPPTDPPCHETAERTLNSGKDVLHKFRWSSKGCVKHFESGFHLPNLEIIVTYAIVNFDPSSSTVNVQLLDKTVILDFRDMTPEFSEAFNIEIVEWDYPTMGDVWQVVFVERDYWNKVEDEFNLGYTWSIKVKDPSTGTEGSHSASIGYKIKSNKNDKKIGSSLLEYCDPVLGEGYLGVDGMTGYKPYSCDVSGGFWFREIIEQ